MPLLLGVPPIGYAAAVLIGLSLGLLGGGGSILTVPALVYLLNMEPKVAIATSLVVVGLAAAVGAAQHAREGRVDAAVTLRFAPIAMVGAFAGARLATFVSGRVQLLTLAVTMVAAAAALLRHRPATSEPQESASLPVMLIAGLGVGLLTGIVGVGGGFLMLPALTELAGVPMRKAVGTSLVVILLNTAAASVGYAGEVAIAWGPALIFGGTAALGTIAGARLAGRLSDLVLRRAFAALLAGIGLFMLLGPSRS